MTPLPPLTPGQVDKCWDYLGDRKTIFSIIWLHELGFTDDEIYDLTQLASAYHWAATRGSSECFLASKAHTVQMLLKVLERFNGELCLRVPPDGYWCFLICKKGEPPEKGIPIAWPEASE